MCLYGRRYWYISEATQVPHIHFEPAYSEISFWRQVELACELNPEDFSNPMHNDSEPLADKKQRPAAMQKAHEEEDNVDE